MKVLALDWGERYVGAAVTDDDGKIALRHSVIDQKETDILDRAHDIVREEQIACILVGVPVSLSGNETEQTHKTLQFIEELRASFQDTIEVIGVDETLTSVEAVQNLRYEGGDKREVHSEAARLILDTYLRS